MTPWVEEGQKSRQDKLTNNFCSSVRLMATAFKKRVCIVWWVLPLIVLLPAIIVVSCIIHDSLQNSRFWEVKAGMTHQEVVSSLGRPPWESGCAAFPLRWNLPTECIKELVYQPLAGEWLPSYSIVYLDKNDKVIEKLSCITSPLAQFCF
jgi:hypothetical protein